MPLRLRWLAVPALLGVGWLWWRLGEMSFWDYEAYMIQQASGSLSQPFRVWQQPPAYFLLLHGWLAGGTGEAWVRSLNVLLGLGGAIVAARLLARLTELHSALLAAVLLPVAPLFLFYTRQATDITLFFLMEWVALGAFVRALDTQQGHHWLWYGLATLAAASVTYVACLGWMARTAWLFMQRRRYRLSWTPWLLTQAACLLPWLCVPKVREDLAASLGYAIGVEHLQASVAAKLGYHAFAWVLGESVLPWSWGVVVPAGAVCLILGWAGARRLLTRPHGGLLLWMLAAVWLVLSASRHGGGKYFYPWLPIVTLLLAEGFWQLKRRMVAWMSLAVLLAVWGVADANYFTGRQYHSFVYLEPWREIGQWMQRELQPGDLLLRSGYDNEALRYYLGNTTAGEEEVRDLVDEPFDPERIAYALPTAVTRWHRDGYRRIWFVERPPGQVSEAVVLSAVGRAMRDWFDRHLMRIERRRFGHDPDAQRKRRWVQREVADFRVTITLYALPP